MKISQIYCNRGEIFPRLKFKIGLNVVYAKVSRPKDSGKDSHNLGKTTLLHLIDFLMLKGLSRGHFLYDHKDIFRDYVFFLELKLNQGGYVTLRRGVKSPTKISIDRNDAPMDMTDVALESWEYPRLPFKRAKAVLNDILQLSALAGWHYRKGVGYFLRTQSDYRDVFQLQRFSRGKDSEWKPYLASIMGFEADPLREKYEIDHEIEDDKKYLARARSRTDSSYDKIKGLLEIKQGEVEDLSESINRFSFHKIDMTHNAELVEEIEQEIAMINTRTYVIDYEVDKIDSSLDTRTIFDLDKVERMFNEAEINFPEELKRDYSDLIRFNQRLTQERVERLSKLRRDLSEEREMLIKRLRELDERRKELMSVVQETDTLNKFRSLQKDLAHRKSEVARLETELEQIDEVARIEKRIQEKKHQRSEMVLRIEKAIRRGSDRYSMIRTSFNRVIRSVLRRIGIISINVNKEGNVDFDVNLQKADSDDLTSEGRGTSYKKLLCAAFDISLLLAYENDSFFRFVYHDGVLEGLDNRKKRAFLEIVRDVCDNHGMQYVLTLIDADIPRDEGDRRVPFRDGEILRELFEGSDEGRLFRMPAF